MVRQFTVAMTAEETEERREMDKENGAMCVTVLQNRKLDEGCVGGSSPAPGVQRVLLSLDLISSTMSAGVDSPAAPQT